MGFREICYWSEREALEQIPPGPLGRSNMFQFLASEVLEIQTTGQREKGVQRVLSLQANGWDHQRGVEKSSCQHLVRHMWVCFVSQKNPDRSLYVCSNWVSSRLVWCAFHGSPFHARTKLIISPTCSPGCYQFYQFFGERRRDSDCNALWLVVAFSQDYRLICSLQVLYNFRSCCAQFRLPNLLFRLSCCVAHKQAALFEFPSNPRTRQ